MPPSTRSDGSRRRGGLPDAGMIAIGFADLVGFTKLGEQLPPEELGRVTGRLEEVAREVAHGPVRLVKLIGDAAMLASADTDGAARGDARAGRGDGRRRRRASRWSGPGSPTGPAFTRGGDYYGAPVNLASRITEVARPGSVLVAPEVREHVDADDYRLLASRSQAPQGHRRATVELYRCRRPRPSRRRRGR